MKDTQMEILTGMRSGRARGNGHKLKHRKLLLDRRRKNIVAIFKHWNRLPENITRFSVLKTFKSQLGAALNNLIYRHVLSREVSLDDKRTFPWIHD